jgi:hypothetical protein
MEQDDPLTARLRAAAADAHAAPRRRFVLPRLPEANGGGVVGAWWERNRLAVLLLALHLVIAAVVLCALALAAARR